LGKSKIRKKKNLLGGNKSFLTENSKNKLRTLNISELKSLVLIAEEVFANQGDQMSL
jgi:hypothetical protein